jgi:oligo-1,6-glucosidase
MIELRSKSPALVYGDYKDLDPANATIFAYTRTLGSEKYLIVLNFSNLLVSYALPGGMTAGKLAISNSGSGQEHAATLNLKPWEARIYKQ